MPAIELTPLDVTIHSLSDLEPARFRVTSNSMFPCLQTGDQVRLQPLQPDQRLRVGDIIVFERNQQLIIHRIIYIKGDQIQTKGDRLRVLDAPLQRKQVLAVAVSALKGKIEFNLQSWLWRVLNAIIAMLSRAIVSQ